MSQSLETWWAVNYSNYSLSDLSVLPIYQRMARTLYPFRRELGGVSEGYESGGEEDSYFWNDEGTGRRERLRQNRRTKEFTYELEYRDGKKTVVVTSRKQGLNESGEVRKLFETWELIEGWAYIPPAKEYSRYSIENGIRKGMKTGVTADGEHWLVEEWSQEGDSTYKKTFEKEGISGGETLTRKGSQTWGQQWMSSSTATEMKSWEELPGRKWGKSSSHYPNGRSALHHYDFSPSTKAEERLAFTAGTVLGYRYRQSGASWLKEEWEGTAVFAPHHSDFDLLTSQVRLQLSDLSSRFLRNLREAANTLALLRSADTSGRIPALLSDIEDFPGVGGEEVEEVVSGLETVAEIAHRVELLTQSVISESGISEKLHGEGDSQEGKIRNLKVQQQTITDEREAEKRKIAGKEAEQQRKMAELETEKQRLAEQVASLQGRLDEEIALKTAAQQEIDRLKTTHLEPEHHKKVEIDLKRPPSEPESQFKKITEQVTERIKTLERELEKRKAMDREADHKRSIEREAEKRATRDAEARSARFEKQLKDAKQENESLKAAQTASPPKPEKTESSRSGKYLSPTASPRGSPKRRASAIVGSDLVTTNSDLVKQVALLRAELSALKGSPSGRLSPAVLERRASPQPGEVSVEPTDQPSISVETEPVDEYITLQAASERDFEAAERLLRSESLTAMENNIILQSMKKNDPAPEKLLTNVNLFRFLEELMDKKLEVDNADLAAHRKPRTMTEFLMEHLNRQFGIKSLAMKFLAQLMPTLLALVQEGHKYAVLYARILQVFHPKPVPFQLALVLARVRPEFHKLIEKCNKERDARDSKRGLKGGEKPQLPQRPGIQAQMDLMSSGGEAFVADVMVFLYEFFDNDRDSGELALQLMRPSQVTLVDFILFKICHKMAKLGMREEAVFSMIDLDGGGTIDREEFVEGIRTSLDLWVSTSDILEAFEALTSEQEMTRDLFLEKCSFSWYQQAVKSDEYTISKCDFLVLMANVYEVRQKRDVAGLMALFESQSEDPLAEGTFRKIMRSLNRRIPAARIDRIWRIGLTQSDSPDGLSKDVFLKLMLRYRTGPFAATKFCTA